MEIGEHRKAGHVVPNNLDLKRLASERDEEREKRKRRRMRNGKC